jgi:hypothetical protein
MFLDSDDLVSPEKIVLHIEAMEKAGATVSYSDCAIVALQGEFDELNVSPMQACHATDDPVELFIKIQPAPHSPVFATDYLKQIVAAPFIPASAAYNPIAEVWFYTVASVRPAVVAYVPGPHALSGIHGGERITNNWERMAVAWLALLEAFVKAAPNHGKVSELVAANAFTSWRGLPRDFSPECRNRFFAAWEQLTRGTTPHLGGKYFSALAGLLGPRLAGETMRLLRNGSYERHRTVTDHAFAQMLRSIP